MKESAELSLKKVQTLSQTASKILMKKVFAEIGFGNDSFFSTEFEEGDKEIRVPKFIMPGRIRSLYFRFWIFKKVFILSTNHGIEIKNKEKNKLKILFGISGESKTLKFTDDAKEKWLSHLSNKPGEVKIVPYDATAPEKFEKVKNFIQSKLGKQVRVEHRGATALGISGQDEIDVYIPVPPNDFDKYVLSVAELFGEPRSLYPLQRARFRTEESGKRSICLW